MTEMKKDTQDFAKIELKDEERQPCEIWTRVMGYHRPVSSFNIGKQGEFGQRRYFEENSCGCN
ncbi:MAG: anaerobic ribonucleoside-triphosphate reductase [Zymomonas mobilis]|uniref:Anaerobic ribonucleoside-triphosphate reductase-like protein n=1 Tax=Zymomonas mobilis TaxID=542 RepID=A0A542W1F8_ZYMMB|nr:anaerobic ribonucleoside-triphosphate reductase [Zymomonas mobilis]TQL17425.1 anaerobic ribonucleoside-triphosphate reductase-like protein [Zymomonas mobilis]